MQRFMKDTGAKSHHHAGEEPGGSEWLHEIMSDANTDRPDE